MSVTVAILAGGLGTRIGGGKAEVELAGRPLISYPLGAARAAGLEAVVVAKRSTRLPPLDVRVLLERDAPTHPLCGIVAALRELEAVIALPCDMPFVSARLLSRLAQAQGDLVVPSTDQPFPGLYRRALLPALEQALPQTPPMRSLLASARASSLGGVSSDALFSVNTPADVETAARRLSRRR